MRFLFSVKSYALFSNVKSERENLREVGKIRTQRKKRSIILFIGKSFKNNNLFNYINCIICNNLIWKKANIFLLVIFVYINIS